MLTIKLKTYGLNFFWAEKGYKSIDGTPIGCPWEDIEYFVYRGKERIKYGNTTIETKVSIKCDIEDLIGYCKNKKDIKFSKYSEEELNSTHWGIPFKDMVNCEEPRWSFSYDDPNSEDFYQILDMINLPTNEDGVYPSYISGYIPEDCVTRANTEAYIRDYVTHFLGLQDEFEFVWIDVPSDEYIEQEYLQEYQDIKKWREERKNKIINFPEHLTLLIGKEKVEELMAKRLTKAERIEGMDDFLFYFEDNHIEMLKAEDVNTFDKDSES